MPIKKCRHGWITPQPARPVGPRTAGAQPGLTLEQYIYLGCGEEVGAPVVLHSAMAEGGAYGSPRPGAAVITAGRAIASQADARGLAWESQPRAGPWAWGSRQGHGGRGKTRRRCICWWLQPFLEPGSSRDKTFPSRQRERLREGKKVNPPVWRCARTKKRNTVRKKSVRS